MKLLLILAFVGTAAYAFDESEFTEQSDPDTMFLDVQNTVAAMKKKGATESDCKDLAKTSCKEVERDRATNQKMLNNLKTGAKCPALGQGAVTKAKNHYTRTRNTWNSKKRALTSAKARRVTFSSQRFSSMSRGNCGFVFSSRNYLNAKSALNAAINAERVWRGKQSEAYKAWQTAIKVAAKMKKRCHCDAQVLAKKLWSTVGNSKLLKKQNRAHSKCKMMSCVLAGTNVRARKCQGALPALRNKVLTSATRRENCRGHKVRQGTGRFRLVNKQGRDVTASKTGALQIMRKVNKGKWGWVCDDSWQSNSYCAYNANVACKEMGFSGYNARKTSNIVGSAGVSCGAKGNSAKAFNAKYYTKIRNQQFGQEELRCRPGNTKYSQCGQGARNSKLGGSYCSHGEMIVLSCK